MNTLILSYLGLDGKIHTVPAESLGLKCATPTPPTPPAATAPTPPAPKAKFKPGDVVTLNSGSPDMTVVDETNGEVRVIYFPETDTAAYACEPCQAILPAVCLCAIPTNEAMY